MGQDGVGVLEVGDEDKPVVNVEVWDTVDDEHFGEAPLDRPVGETSNDGTDSDIRHDDLRGLGISEDVRLGVVVVGSNGVAELSRSVVDQVQGPAEELVHHHVQELEERSVFDGFSELGLSESGDVGTLDLLIVLDSGVTQLRSSSGNKDLVSGQVTSSGVVLAVRDSPRVVRDKENRVQDPSDKVVDVLAGRVTLVTTLVGNDPETGTEETSHESVSKVESDLGGGEGDLAQVKSRQEGVNVVGSVNQERDSNDISSDIGRRLEGGSVVAVSRDSVEQLLYSVVGDDELLAVFGLLDLLLFDEGSLFGDSLPDWGRSTLSERSRHGG